MGVYDIRPCPCGSGKPSHWIFDARQIPMARVCSDCEKAQRAKFRNDVQTNPNYETDEPIDEET